MQTFAEQDNYPLERLGNILHNFVSDTAEKWWWVYKRGHPYARWAEVSTALITRFGNLESDRSTRRLIEFETQKTRASFSDFSMDIE